MTISVRQDRELVRATYRSHRYVLATVTAPTVERTGSRPSVNLAFVIDRSGSMAGAKLPLAKAAVEQAIGRLDADDRFAVVTYDNEVDVVLTSTPASAEAASAAWHALATIEPRGSTDLGEGWLTGCRQVALGQRGEGVDRCLLLSDGLANMGITDRDELARHAAELRDRGVSTTTFGIGDDFDERLMQLIAEQGGGNFYYIEDARQIPDFITSEVGEALDVVARGVAIEVAGPPHLDVDALGIMPIDRRGDRTVIRLPDLVSGQELSLVIRLTFPYGQEGDAIAAAFSVRDRTGVLDPTVTTLSWRYGSSAENDAQPRDRTVDRAVATAFAARARREAVELQRQGDYAGAERAIRGVAKRIRAYAGSDAQLREQVRVLEDERVVYAAPMPMASLKQAHFLSTNALRSRDATGRSRRQPPA
jgi:Ca-activated chloride channel family protein